MSWIRSFRGLRLALLLVVLLLTVACDATVGVGVYAPVYGGWGPYGGSPYGGWGGGVYVGGPVWP